MPINAIDNSTSLFSLSDFRTSKPSFEMIENPLQRAERVIEQGRDPRQAAQQFVATALITPLLAELRDEPLSSDFLDGGFGEDVFRQQLDTLLADRITRKSNFSIVDAVYRKLTDQAERTVDTHG